MNHHAGRGLVAACPLFTAASAFSGKKIQWNQALPIS
jgi:hypothetical protein